MLQPAGHALSNNVTCPHCFCPDATSLVADAANHAVELHVRRVSIHLVLPTEGYLIFVFAACFAREPH